MDRTTQAQMHQHLKSTFAFLDDPAIAGISNPKQMQSMQRLYGEPKMQRLSKKEQEANLEAFNTNLEAQARQTGQAFVQNTQGRPIEERYEMQKQAQEAFKAQLGNLTEEQQALALNAFNDESDVFKKADQEAGFFTRAGDALTYIPTTLTKFGEQAVGLVAPDSTARKWLTDATKTVEDWRSDESKLRSHISAQKMAEAKANGETGFTQFIANARENPQETLGQFAESAIPTVAAALAAPATGGASLAIPLGVGAIQAGGATRNDIYDRIMAMPQAELNQSPQYQALLAKGLSPEQARNELASSLIEHGGEVAATAVSGAVLNKLGGLSRLGQAGKGVLGSSAGKFVSEALTEPTDEVFQQFMANKAVRDVNSNQSLTEGLGEAAAAGLLFGAAGGGIAAVDNTLRQPEQPSIAPESPTQTQPNKTQTTVNESALASVLQPFDSTENYAEYKDELESDIRDGVIAERANSNTEYGRLAKAYLEATGQVAPEAQAEQAVENPQQNAKAETQAEAELQQSANTAPTENRNVIAGAEDSVDIGNNNYQPFQYEVMEADDLAPTQQKAGNQLRDRERVASQEQVNKIARNLDPRKIADSPTMDFGAPLLAQDGKTVIAGNGRSMAIRQAYSEGNAQGYRDYLQQNAAKFGIDENQLSQMKNPVLVRRLNTAVDIKQTAINSNEQGGMRMSNLEQAKVDAQRLPNMAGFDLDESGNWNTENNRSFITQFIQNQPETLRNELIDSKGRLSQTGEQRMRNAMLFQAYGDTDTLARMVESTDQGERNIINALTRIAPKVAQVKQDIAHGDVSDVDISADIVQAVEKYNQLRNQNVNVGEYLQQQDFVGDLTPEAKAVLRIFDENARSSKRIGDILTSYYQTAETQGNANQASMFGDEEFDKTGTLEQAKQADLEARYSRSPIKSVEANIKRGRNAMNIAIAEHRTVHRAMFNHNLDGWVDFEWGDDGLIKPFNKKGEPVGKGISHIIEARMRKDGMSYDQVTKMLTSDIVETIAKGSVAGHWVRNEGKSESIQIDYNGHRAGLIRNKGSNAWLLTAFELYPTDVNSAGSVDTEKTTHSKPTLTRQGAGAVGQNNQKTEQGRGATTAELRTSDPIRSRIGVGASDTNNVQQSTTERNSEDTEITQVREILRQALGEHADKIELVRSEQFNEDDGRHDAEGWYLDGKPYINIDNIQAGRVLSKEQRLVWVAWHELAHHGVKVKFSQTLENQMAIARKNAVVGGIARRIRAERKAEAERKNDASLEITETIATEEALVELLAAMETGNWAEIESRYNVKIAREWKNPQGALAKTLSRAVAYFKRLIATVTGKNVDNVSEREILGMLATIKQGIANDGENATASDTRYSLNEEANSPFAKAVDVVSEGGNVSGYVNVGTTPDVLKMLGLPDVSVTIHGSTFKKVMGGKHNIMPETLKQLPKHLNDPIAVMRSNSNSSNPNGYIVLTELVENENGKDKPVIAALHLRQDANGLELLNIASVYGRSNPQIQRGLDNDLLYWNNKKGTNFVDTFGLQLPAYVSQNMSQKGSQFVESFGLQLPAKIDSETMSQSEVDIKTEADLSQYQSENSDVRYSRKAPTQTESYQRDLMVTHNISAKGIMHAKKMGGLPFASVAVAKQSNPLTGFGEVTLIGDRNYIDPKGKNKAQVFGADVYSPRHSDLGISYRINMQDVNVLNKQFEASAKEIGDNRFAYDFSYQGLEEKGLANVLENSTAVKYQFLKENGITVEPVYDAPVEIKQPELKYPVIQKAKEQDISRSQFVNNDELLTRFAEEQVVDFTERLARAEKMGNPLVINQLKRKKSVAEKILESGIESIRHHYRHQILNLKYDEEAQVAEARLNPEKTAIKINELVAERASDFADYVDNITNDINMEERIDNGENRDGTRKTIPHTIDNVVRKLKQNIRGGENFNVGLGNVRAKVTPQFDSIADIQDNKHRIISSEDFQKVRDELEDEATALANELGTSGIYDVLWNAVDEGVAAAFKYADVTNTARNRKLVQDYLDKLEAMPTEYFEGKAKDITQFSDFAGAVVPNNLPNNAYKVLQEAGLKLYEYDPEVENSRKDVIKQATNELDEQTSGGILFSRPQSAMDILESGRVEPQTWVGQIKSEGFGKWWIGVQKKIDYAMTDETRPVIDWIEEDLNLSRVEQNALRQDMEHADGIRQDLNSKVTQRFLKPLQQNIAKVAKKHNKDVAWTKSALGLWYSARYSIIKNQELLKREEQAMLEAQKVFDDAKQNGTAAEVDKAERAYIKAERQYRYRKRDVNLNNWEVDEKGNFKVPRKVGVAGFSIPHAKAIMAKVEESFSAQEIETAMKPLRDAVEWNVRKNREANRITDEQAKEYLRNPDYVPLTGDPDAQLEDDFIGGANAKGVNTSKDKNMKGRTNSEAEDAIDAVYKMLDKTIANAAWQPFKNGLDAVYEQKIFAAKQQGLTENEAKQHVADTHGIQRQVMQGTTRSSDDVLIRKFGDVYYEYRLPEKVIKALKGGRLDIDDFNAWNLPVVRHLRQATGLYARGVTQFKLPFAPKNMIRDIWEKSALISTREILDANGNELSQKAKNRIGNKTFSALWNPAETKRIMKATARLAKGDTENLDLNDEYQADLKELIELGGVSNYSTYLARTEKDLISEIKKINNPKRKVVEGVSNLLAIWNGTFDYASSLAAYRALKSEGVDAKQAANITLNLTNFRKQGWAAKHFKPLYMFLNPTLQGGKNLIQMMKTRRGQVYVAGRTVMAMLMWSILMSLDDDDDEGGKRMLSNGDLSREILIPTGVKDKYIRIPVGYGAPQAVNNLASNLVQLMNGQISTGDAVANIIAHNVKSVMPVAPSEISASKDPLAKLADTLTPSLFKSATQWATDRNAFGGKIKPGFVQSDKLLSQQSKSTTAAFWEETAKWLYDNVGVDNHPELYKHIFDSYRGMLGSMGDFLSSKIENPNRALHGRAEVTPIINDFFGVRGEHRISGLYYQYKGEAENVMKEYNYHEKEGTLAQWRTPEKMQIVKWNQMADSETNKIRKEKAKLNKLQGKISDEVLAQRLQRYNEANDRIQRKMVYEWRKREGLATSR